MSFHKDTIAHDVGMTLVLKFIGFPYNGKVTDVKNVTIGEVESALNKSCARSAHRFFEMVDCLDNIITCASLDKAVAQGYKCPEVVPYDFDYIGTFTKLTPQELLDVSKTCAPHLMGMQPQGLNKKEGQLCQEMFEALREMQKEFLRGRDQTPNS